MAKAYQCDPTGILDSNIDSFITCINYFNMKADKEVERKLKKYGVDVKPQSDPFRALL